MRLPSLVGLGFLLRRFGGGAKSRRACSFISQCDINQPGRMAARFFPDLPMRRRYFSGDRRAKRNFHETRKCRTSPAWRFYHRCARAAHRRDFDIGRLGRCFSGARVTQPHPVRHERRLFRKILSGRSQHCRLSARPRDLFRSGSRFADHRLHGPLRKREDPRPRHSRSHRGDPARAIPSRCEGCGAEATVVGDRRSARAARSAPKARSS